MATQGVDMEGEAARETWPLPRSEFRVPVTLTPLTSYRTRDPGLACPLPQCTCERVEQAGGSG